MVRTHLTSRRDRTHGRYSQRGWENKESLPPSLNRSWITMGITPAICCWRSMAWSLQVLLRTYSNTSFGLGCSQNTSGRRAGITPDNDFVDTKYRRLLPTDMYICTKGQKWLTTGTLTWQIMKVYTILRIKTSLWQDNSSIPPAGKVRNPLNPNCFDRRCTVFTYEGFPRAPHRMTGQ